MTPREFFFRYLKLTAPKRKKTKIQKPISSSHFSGWKKLLKNLDPKKQEPPQ